MRVVRPGRKKTPYDNEVASQRSSCQNALAAAPPAPFLSLVKHHAGKPSLAPSDLLHRMLVTDREVKISHR